MMNLEKAISELKESCVTGRKLKFGTDAPLRKCFDCMEEQGIDSTSFVLDEDFYGGIEVERKMLMEITKLHS